MIKLIKRYIFQVLVSIDQLINALTFGDPDETISSRLGKWRRDRDKISRHKVIIADSVCWVLDKVDRKHCKKSIDETEGKDDLL